MGRGREVSPSNSAEETREKVRAYLAAGALEVWVVLEDGRVKYFDATREVAGTRFPVRLELPGPLPR